MASIQYKTGKNNKRTYYVVLSISGKHKWVKEICLKNAKSLKKQLESLEESKRIEKLGLSTSEKKIDIFMSDYIENVRLHTSPNTLKRYKSIINSFLIFLKMFHPSIKYLSQIKTQTIESYQQKRLESIELKIKSDGVKTGVHSNKRLPLPQTVNYEISVLRSAFIWAKDRELIFKIPTAKVKKLKVKEKKDPVVLTIDECSQLLNAGKELSKSNSSFRPYYLAIKFILNTGLRSGELCNLTWSDIELDSGLLKIQAKPGWTPKSYARSFYLNETAIKLLDRLRSRDGYIFKDINNNQLQPDNLRRMLIKIAKQAGFENFTRVHDLRHIYNSHLQMNGVDPNTACMILGHQDIKTNKIYSHQTIQHLKESANKIEIK